MSVTPHTQELSELADLNPNLSERLNVDALVSFVPMSGVTAETATTTSGEDRRYSDVSKGYTPFLSGDLLVAKITPCFENGKIAQAKLAHRVGFGSTEFHVVRPKADRADARYLLHFLRQERVRRDGERKMTGSAGQRRVPEYFLARLKVPVPPLPEQRRIAEVLDRAEALRAKRRAALAQLDTLAQSIFLDMFGDPATNPMGWSQVTIADICRVKGGKRLPKGEEYSATPTPFRYIRVTDLQSGAVDESALVYLKPEIQAEISRYIVGTGDVIISIAGSIGLVAPVPASLDGANLTENAAKLVPRVKGRYDEVFLAAFLQTSFGRVQIMSHVGQVTIGKLALFRIEKIRVPLPTIEAQRRFARCISAVAQSRAAHCASLTALDTLFASLQHRAFRGEL